MTAKKFSDLPPPEDMGPTEEELDRWALEMSLWYEAYESVTDSDDPTSEQIDQIQEAYLKLLKERGLGDPWRED